MTTNHTIETLLADAEQMPITADTILPVTVGFKLGCLRIADGKYVEATTEQVARAARLAAAVDAAKKAAAEAEVARDGGWTFPVEGGFCKFAGRNLWSSGQSRRWVGVFSTARSIDRFLDSPRGEFSFDVRGLKVSERIMGGGYDTNSRGQRRKESEFFAHVVRVDTDAIVIRVYGTRSECLSAK